MAYDGLNAFLTDGGFIDKCEECGGKMKYTGVGEYVCESCSHVMLNDYGKVRNYIEKHPGANLAEVSEATGVGKNKIRQLLREEKIEIAGNSVVFLHCESCGAPIRSGYYCESCAKIAKTIQAKQDAADRKSTISGGFAKTPTGATGEKRFKR